MKVTMDKVQVVNDRVPLPTNEVTIVVEAVLTFIVWPKHLIRVILEPR